MKYESEVKGRARYGVRAFADALLVIPKTLGKFLTHPVAPRTVKRKER